jgi:hypothetical protein
VNFLELVNRTRVECGVSGASTPLSAVTNLTGESARIAAWVNNSWVDVQTIKSDWQWMRKPVEFTTTAGKQVYTPAEAGIGDTFANWKPDSFRCSTAGNNYGDEQLLNFMEFTTFRNLYQYGNMRHTQQRPVVVTSTPEKNLALGATPSAQFVIGGEYYAKPSVLTAATDTPSIPDRFHMLIVYRAMMAYGSYEAAPEVLQRGQSEYKTLMNRLEIDQLPAFTSGPPLA